MRENVGRAIVQLCLLGIGCRQADPIEPQQSVDGTYALVYYGPDRVPANVGELPTQPGGGPSGCFLRVTQGEIHFTASSSLFRYQYEFHNSCDGRLLSREDVQGRYLQDGPRITFTVVGPGGDQAFEGEVRSDTVIIRRETPSLTFAR